MLVVCIGRLLTIKPYQNVVSIFNPIIPVNKLTFFISSSKANISEPNTVLGDKIENHNLAKEEIDLLTSQFAFQVCAG